MSYIHKDILDYINSYKLFLEQNINNLININNNNPSINLFATGEYKLFSIIIENVRMDLNYLLVLNPDFDILGFPAIKRNLRISIEAYYDLFNLVSDRSYFELLQYQSVKNINIDNNTLTTYQPYTKRKSLSNINKYPLTISEKANIAINKNQLRPDIYNNLKNIATDANSYIHPDIFAGNIGNRDALLKLLIFNDCKLIAYAFDLLNIFMAKYPTPYISLINPYTAYDNLYNATAYIAWIYLWNYNP